MSLSGFTPGLVVQWKRRVSEFAAVILMTVALPGKSVRMRARRDVPIVQASSEVKWGRVMVVNCAVMAAS